MLSDAEIAAQQAVEDGYTRDGISAMKSVMLMAIVPIGLLLITFSAIFGDWVWEIAPAVFIASIAAIYGMPIYRVWRGLVDSEQSLDIPGYGRITDQAKWRLATGGAVLMLAAIVVYIFADLVFSVWFGRLRDWVLGITIP